MTESERFNLFRALCGDNFATHSGNTGIYYILQNSLEEASTRPFTLPTILKSFYKHRTIQPKNEYVLNQNGNGDFTNSVVNNANNNVVINDVFFRKGDYIKFTHTGGTYVVYMWDDFGNAEVIEASVGASSWVSPSNARIHIICCKYS